MATKPHHFLVYSTPQQIQNNALECKIDIFKISIFCHYDHHSVTDGHASLHHCHHLLAVKASAKTFTCNHADKKRSRAMGIQNQK